MNDPMLPLPGLSPASGKPVVVRFDGGLLSSDGRVLALREVEQRLRLADRLAACIVDPLDLERNYARCAGGAPPASPFHAQRVGNAGGELNRYSWFGQRKWGRKRAKAYDRKR